MICPVEITDHTSSLIAADWHEEQGNQIVADEIRIKVTVPFFVISARYPIAFCRYKVVSTSGTRRVNRRHSSCGRKRGVKSRSTCMYGSRGYYSQWSRSSTSGGGL